jgi:ribosomal protein S18 acetylase RimI-like enzyme
VTLRPPEDDDFDAMLELMNAHQLAAFGEADLTEDELRTWLTSPSVEIERDIRVLEQDGRLVGYVDVDSNGADPPLWWCDVKLAPDVDEDAIAAELVGGLEQRLDSGRVRVWSSATDTRVVSAFERLGFAPARHSYRMEIGLAQEPAEPFWPAGISVRTLADGEERTIYDGFMEVWQDTSDPPHDTFEDWSHWMTRAETFEPSLWFLALAGAELAGFAICREDTNDPAAGHVELLGVRRSWRRQGLGHALLLHSFRAFRLRGWTRGTLGVDASSPTGATRLYERAGMSIYRDTLFLERPARR